MMEIETTFKGFGFILFILALVMFGLGYAVGYLVFTH
jgi:hypothetical protein